MRSFNDLITGAGACLLVGCAAWSVLICIAALLEAVTAGRLRATSWVGCPPAVRQALLAGLGVAIVATPVQAQSIPGSRATTTRPSTGSFTGPFIGPFTGTTTPEPALPVPARPLGGGPRTLVVQPGDNLWQLAETGLPGSAPAPEVARRVELLHRANRIVIGPDPDLILPGQRLVTPPPPRPPAP